jgi:sporulation protein YlmC with PRC-barrel domain
MLRSIKELEGYTVSATDGDVGRVKDCYFDDEAWVIRYFVVGTGEWLGSRRVLISPLAIGHPSWSGETLSISITREQVKNSPDIDTDKPVSRQHEIAYSGYYGYPCYWGGTGLWGDATYPGTLLTGVGYDGIDREYKNLQANAASKDGRHRPADQHLRSCNVVSKYRVHASDGDLGHVEGLLVDERTWSIRYMIVGTSNWWVGHSVLISPEWIDDVSWSNEKVSIDLTRQAIKDAPLYDPAAHLSRDYESVIYKHYGRAGYWTENAKHRIAS